MRNLLVSESIAGTVPDTDWLPSGSLIKTYAAGVHPEEFTSSSSFVLGPDRQIAIVQVRSRGWDIPGGHREGKETPAQTIQREIAEEIGLQIHLQNVEPVGYTKLEVPNAGSEYKYGSNSYMLYSVVRIDECLDLQPADHILDECASAKWLSLEEFIQVCQHRIWMPLAQQILNLQ